MTSLKPKEGSLDFYSISRSHLYWGRKHTNGLAKVLQDLEPGEILLDPFCGGGTPILTALRRGARVIASDLNPMAVFLSKGLIRPIGIFALKEAFQTVRDCVADSILENYAISCPKCGKKIHFDYLKWNTKDGVDIPEAAQVNCKGCGLNELSLLSKNEISRQLDVSKLQPKFWFPQNPIRTKRKTKATFLYQLFTGRNLTSLAQLHHAIQNIPSVVCRETLHYVFTGMLYNCSLMQMFSSKFPSSSRGWTAPRFYLPSARKEKNVWQAFENRFKTVLNCKEKMNSFFGSVRISNSLKEFEDSGDMAYIYQADFLNFLFPKKLNVTHVFLDPPYNVDVDYMGFSEFWGCWLGMSFDIEAGWHPGNVPIEENAERLFQLLLRIGDNTSPSCKVTLAYGSKRPDVWPLIRETIFRAGYDLQDKSLILWDNPQKRKMGEFAPTDRYFLLTRKSKRISLIDRRLADTDWSGSEKELSELKLFIRVAAHLSHSSSPERILELTNDLVRPQLRTRLSELRRNQIEHWIQDEEQNRKAYNRLCLTLIEPILSEDGYKIASVDITQFDDSEVKGYAETKHFSKSKDLAEDADFVAKNDKDHRLLFCFYDKRKEDLFKRISKQGLHKDAGKFQTIWFLIFPTHEQMIKHRQAAKVENWPRGFFLCIGEIAQKAIELHEDNFRHLEKLHLKTKANYRSQEKIKHFVAKVISNNPVKKSKDCKHYKITFKAPDLKYIVPGQFVMVDTLPVHKRRDIEEHTLPTSKEHLHFNHALDLKPTSFLKRPFSIHRAFYKYFEFGYLKNMSLPLTLATISHTHFPERFEIFYKVLENGIGTNELTLVKKGDKIEMLGPLGRFPTLSKWRSNEIEEIHLVGGGVGMAPLVFFGQALKFYSFRLKAFIGIDRIETLLYSARFAPTFSEDRRSAYVYIETLSGIGLRRNDIFVSCEVLNGTERKNGRLPKENYHAGFVTEQYESYLESLTEINNILVITCGPQPMLRALERITARFNLPMKVLLEERMACGIGVCLSCVCRTKKQGSQKYSRVCTEGPLFDSKDIVWE